MIFLKKLLILIIFSNQITLANDESLNNHNSENNKDDLKRQKLDSIIQEARLLPTLDNVGGSLELYGESVNIEGDRAIIGSSNAAASGVAYIYDFDGVNWIETQFLVSEDINGGDQFGVSVSLSGDRVLIGAPYDDDNDSASGSAYIFELENGVWVQTAKLIASDGSSSDNFGAAVSLSGNKALIGAKTNFNGSAYIFEENSGIWAEKIKLTPLDILDIREFGISVDLDNNRALIGAKESLTNTGLINTGAAYIFQSINGSWEQVIKLIPLNGSTRDGFGYSVSISGDNVLVGAPWGDVSGDDGSAYVFDNSTGSWLQSAKLTAINGDVSGHFGRSLFLDENKAAIGGYSNVNGVRVGSAYIFDLEEGTWFQTDTLTASDGETNDFFGSSISLSANRVLIGAYGDGDDSITTTKKGSAYVFDIVVDNWVETKKLEAVNGVALGIFGNSVSIDGNRALIGSYHDNDNGTLSGSAYIFDYTDGEWLQSIKLIAHDGKSRDYFGSSVSLVGNKALIGAYGNDENGGGSGAVYIFEYTNEEWIETEKLTASDPTNENDFGYSVSLNKNRALIGARETSDNGFKSGSAYIFDYTNGAWTETVKLLPEDGQAYDSFGSSVSLDGNRALIGAHLSDDNGSRSGSAYIFDLFDNSWSQSSKLIASNAVSDDRFGASISLDKDRALIGTQTSNSGSAYIFELLNGLWVEIHILTSSSEDTSDNFGNSVSLNDNKALVGANLDPRNGYWIGAAYLFEFSNNTWLEYDYMSSSNSSYLGNSYFGSSVNLGRNGRFIIGAPSEYGANYSSGAAYIYIIDSIFSNEFE